MKIKLTVLLFIVVLMTVSVAGSSFAMQGLGKVEGYRGSILYYLSDPSLGEEGSYEFYEDGILVVDREGRIVEVGPASSIHLPPGRVTDYSGKLIMPGFIDTHVHYAQTPMIASFGETLLGWLDKYTFPTEIQFADDLFARDIAEQFLNELMRNGTTTALVFSTKHKGATEQFFLEAKERNLRMISGITGMDRNAPEDLLDTPESWYADSQELIDKYHGNDRLLYAVTPRFAITSTDEQLAKGGELLANNPDVYLHTHLSENLDEIDFTLFLFPDATDYLNVYENFDLVQDKSVFAHGIWLSDDELDRLATAGSALSHCPTSNFFLGSGLFPLRRAQAAGIEIGVGTDVGAGTSFSQLETLEEAYKVSQLRRIEYPEESPLTPIEAFYLATLGGAEALELEDTIGTFQPGYEADFIVLDWNEASELLALRQDFASTTLSDRLFALQILGGGISDIVEQTYIMGQPVLP